MSPPAVTMSTPAWIIFVNFATFICLAIAETSVVDILMPNARPAKDDSYLCYPMEFSDKEVYITKFEAIAHSDVAHHMILYGCEVAVVSHQPVNCNKICSRGKYILYAWARNAPPVHMPDGVATAVGGKIQYLNLQIHYLHGFSREAEPDRSGVKLTITDQRPQYLAGIFLMLSNEGNIPPNTNEYAIDVTCQYPETKLVIHPFAFRVHSHTLGNVISAFKYYNGTYEKLGKGNPMWPQAFYPMDQVHTVSPGDTLVARCVYNSTSRHRQTVLGSTHNDEMCNFYIMYYSSHPMQKQECDGNTLPQVALNLPQDSLIPMEPNPELDAIAEGHHHHHPQSTVGDADEDDHDGDTEAGKDADVEQKADIWRGVREDVSWSVTGVKLGQVTGVAVDSVGHAHVFHRGSRVWDSSSFNRNNRFTHETEGPIKEDTVVAFDSNGKATKQWGSNMFYMPHGLHMDHSDNIYITDVALHQVMRFPAGQHQADLTLGEEFKPGSDDHHFCMPTDVAVLSSGEFFVSDGYCNSRILKFSSTGQLLLKWGSKSLSIDGVYPPPTTFVILHSLTLMAKQQQLCVSDRGNARLQIFSLTGDFIRQIHPVEIGGLYYAASYSQVNGALYVVNGLDAYEPDTAVGGYTILMSNTSVIESWGPRNQSFQRPHDIAVDSTGTHLYVTEIGPNKLWRLSISQPSHPSKGLHQSVKKDHSFHPKSVDRSEESAEEEKISRVTEQEAGDFGVSLMIGALLVVPVIIVIIVTIIVRLRKNGKLRFFTHNNNKHNRRFNLGNFFRRHRGFDRVRTEGDPELDHLNSDSEIEEYNATGNLKA